MPHTQAGIHRSITLTAIVALIAALVFVQLPPALAATPEYCGKTVLGRMMYVLRHSESHLAEMSLALRRRGYLGPEWR